MLHIDRHHDSQLAAHLSSLDYDSYVSDTAVISLLDKANKKAIELGLSDAVPPIM